MTRKLQTAEYCVKLRIILALMTNFAEFNLLFRAASRARGTGLFQVTCLSATQSVDKTDPRGE